jgi:hypothetical protein
MRLIAYLKNLRVMNIRIFPIFSWLVVNLGIHQLFRALTRIWTVLLGFDQSDQGARLIVWFLFLAAATLANFVLAFVEGGRWRVVFLVTAIMTPISGIFGGTLGMGYVLYAPKVFLDTILVTYENFPTIIYKLYR